MSARSVNGHLLLRQPLLNRLYAQGHMAIHRMLIP